MNIASYVRILSGLWKFLSDYWQVLTALAAIITIFILVIGMFFKRYLQKKQHEHERETERLRQEHDKQVVHDFRPLWVIATD
jgi:membrane protein implicated in regulation of membrane protease activity